MQFVENVTIVGRSLGENNIIVVQNENTGETMSLLNPNGIEVELGMEGGIVVVGSQQKYLKNFEPALVEELV